MKFNFSKKIIVLLFLMVLQFSFAQKKKEDNIGSEVVNVVKPYTPTISDASKVQESPVLDDEGNAKKETINYSIFSFPVASTFAPAKGKAEGVDKEAKEKFFNNYATLGYGNYGNLNAELFINKELGKNDYVGGMFRHFSSSGGVNDVPLDSWFYDTTLDATYGVNNDNMSWNVDLGYQNQVYNWFGLPTDFGSTLNASDRNNLIGNIDAKHAYNGISLGGKMRFNEGAFKETSMKFSHFSDSYGSSENRFYIKPSLQFDVANQFVNTDITVDYVGGSFDKNYLNTSAIKYGFTNLGLSPSFVIQENGWNVKLGASLFYSIDNKGNNSKFLIYPNINVSYPVVEDLMIFYAGAEGGLEQNSYMDFVKENPFLSPTLMIAPTDKQYDVFAGLKGKLASSVSYNLRGSYNNERNKAFFRANDYTENMANENYAYGNSFQVVYDDVRTFRFSGDLKADFSENVSFGIGGTFNSYKNTNEQEAWNLPAVEVNLSIDFNITPKWFAGAKFFYVGKRKDLQLNSDLAPVTNFAPTTLGSYFDLNSHVGYKYNSQLTAFVKLNNMTGKSYQKWMNYPVQGFQVLVGANFKFDF